MKTPRKTTMSFKLGGDLDSELSDAARDRGVTKSELVREAVAAYLVGEPEPRPWSFADRAADLAGCVDGPVDLSTAPEHLAGYGG
jgi:predicted transcriptional regulator